jgi:2-isopropylmalate synthase
MVKVFDTTLRDGAQSQDVSFVVEDKIRIALKLDELGFHYIEGGWPGANPKDTEFFETAKKLRLEHAKIAAFGSTHRPGFTPETDQGVQNLVSAETPVITIFGKTWDLHVHDALQIPLEENLKIIQDSVSYLKARTGELIYDAEHFFDGYKNNPEYAVQTLRAAAAGGADVLVLCDTNGGTLPDEVFSIICELKKQIHTPLGIHTHNDGECAVANTLSAVDAGAVHVQGTINGIGERCGNANLVSVLPNLVLKKKIESVAEANLKKLKSLSRLVAELSNHSPFNRQPFVGDSAFAHKGGIHVSAVQKNAATYEHIRPEMVGNTQKILVSDQAGKSNVLSKAAEFGVELDPKSPQARELTTRLKELENEGYEYAGAEASFELVMRKSLGQHVKHFDLIGYRVHVEHPQDKVTDSEVTVKLMVGGREEHTAGAGNGPVHALDQAMRKALYTNYPSLQDVRLVDYKVRVLTTGRGTSAKVRVLIESTDGENIWNTVGVSENIIEASWEALSDSLEFKLLLDEQEKDRIVAESMAQKQAVL